MLPTSRALALTGGLVLDDHGQLHPGAVFTAEAEIVDAAAAGADQIDLTDIPGAIIVPGMIDLHVHAFRGQNAGIDADLIGPRTGVTTMVDAGSAGAHLIDAFKVSTIDTCTTRVLPFLNVSTIGITSFNLCGELQEPAYLDREAALAALNRHRGVIVGIKVRASHNVGGSHTGQALTFARQLATDADLPLMVHLGPAPCAVDDIVNHLLRGDILTHAFSGWPGNTLLDEHNQIRPAVAAARNRGVVFDVGFGATGFDEPTAGLLFEQGFLPDTISSDIHAHNTRVSGLIDVINALLTAGLTVDQILPRVTHRPGDLLRRPGLGRLIPHLSPADVTVLAPAPPADLKIGPMMPAVALTPILTVRNGHVTYDRRGIAA